MNRKKLITGLNVLLFLLIASPAFAVSESESQLDSFLQGLADFLIVIIGPAILVIGVVIGGLSMATGNEFGLRKGIVAAIGGALIMMSRSILDLIQRLTGF